MKTANAHESLVTAKDVMLAPPTRPEPEGQPSGSGTKLSTGSAWGTKTKWAQDKKGYWACEQDLPVAADNTSYGQTVA